MIPFKTVNDLINKHALLEKELSSSEIDKNSFAEKSKEYAELNEIIKIAKFYISFEKNKKEIKTSCSDSEKLLLICRDFFINSFVTPLIAEETTITL